MQAVERAVAALAAADEAASATPPVIVPFAPLPKEDAEDEAEAPEGAPQKRRRCAPKEQAEEEAEAPEG